MGALGLSLESGSSIICLFLFVCLLVFVLMNSISYTLIWSSGIKC